VSARLTRRSFLALGAVVVAGGAATARLLTDDGEEWSGNAATVAELFDDPEAVRELGEAYLAQSGERDPTRLLAADVQRALRARNGEALRRAVRARSAQEAAADELISVGGWLVAPTEARLAALLAAS
jgi:hypothetical protein